MTAGERQQSRWRRMVLAEWALTAVVLAATGLAAAAAPIPAGARPAPRVTLQWKASTSRVVGYFVYRGEKPGGPYKRITRSVVVGTQYVDQGVRRGRTYFYVVTSVDPRGVEGPRSGEIRAMVPKG